MNHHFLLRAIALFFIGLLFSACGHIEVYAPTARVYSPEIGAQNTLNLNINNNAAAEYVLTESANERPPAFENTATSMSEYSGTFEISAKDWLSLGVGFFTPLGLQGKVQAQLWGPKKYSTDIGSSFSVFADGVYSSDSESGDQAVDFGPGGFPWKAHGSVIGIGTGASLGYRFAPNWMVYIGTAYQSVRTNVKVEQSRSDDGTDPGGNYENKVNGFTTNSVFGLEIGGHSLKFAPTFEYSEIHWGTQSIFDTKIGGSLEFRLR